MARIFIFKQIKKQRYLKKLTNKQILNYLTFFMISTKKKKKQYSTEIYAILLFSSLS